MSAQPKDRVYCSGLWNISNNNKRSADHYWTHIPKTLDMMAGASLIFWSDDAQAIEAVSKEAAARDITLEPREVAIDALPGWEIAEKFVSCCAQMNLDALPNIGHAKGEKGFAHYRRDLQGSGPDVYRRVLAIWLSKISLAATAARENGGSTWVDASISRFNETRPGWDFTKAVLPKDKLCHYRNQMKFYGIPLPVNASFLSAETAIWDELETLFWQTADMAAQMPYGHDEETILGHCHWSRPELFQNMEEFAPPPSMLRSVRQKVGNALKGGAKPSE